MSSLHATEKSISPASLTSDSFTNWMSFTALFSTILFFVGQIVYLFIPLSEQTPSGSTFLQNSVWLSNILILGLLFSLVGTIVKTRMILAKLTLGASLLGVLSEFFFFEFLFFQHIRGLLMFYPILPLSFIGGENLHRFMPIGMWEWVTVALIIGGILVLRERPLRWGNYLPFGMGIAFLALLYPEWAFRIAFYIPASFFIKVNIANIITLAPFLILNVFLSVALMQSSRRQILK